MSIRDRYAGPDVLPDPGLVRAGDRVAYGWDEGESVAHHRPLAPPGLNLLVWHWCDYSVWRADPTKNPAYIPESQWVPSGCGAHDLVAVEPLHLEPSVYWPDCCGLHGWIRNGQWVPA